MNVKVYCPCGAKFSFPVEPVDGHMPVGIACPVCGQDTTQLANDVIRQQLEAEGGSPGAASTPPPAPRAIPPSAPRAIPPTPAPTEAPAAPAAPEAPAAAPAPKKNRLRISASPKPPTAPQPATQPAEATPSQQAAPKARQPTNAVCLRHDGKRAHETCRVCGKPICPKCMELFGYVCSPYCMNRAEAEGMKLPVYRGQRTRVERGFQKKVRLVSIGIAAAILLLIGAGFYYKLYASKPHIVHQYPVTSEDYAGGICRFLDADTYLSIAGGDVSVRDANSGEAIWRAPLSEGESGFASWLGTRLLDTTTDIWLLSGDTVRCFARDNGEVKHTVQLADSPDDYQVTEEGVIFMNRTGSLLDEPKLAITRLRFIDGQVEQEEISVGSRDSAPDIILAGDNVVEFHVKLLEERVEFREAMRPQGESIVDSGQVSGANAMQAAQEIINEWVREETGGRERIDVSLYHVDLIRHMAADAAPWSQQVVGEVTFYPMDEVDLLLTGTTLHVFGKNNELKWKTELTYQVDEAFRPEFGRPSRPPAIIADNTLYFFDRGMLTAFDLASGEARWRVTSVGIRRVQRDDRGDLYVTTTTKTAEDLQYSQEVDIMEDRKSVLMKVSGDSGKVLWQTTMAGTETVITGDFIYSSKAKMDFASMLNPENATMHFRVYRIDPKNGQRIWEYYQQKTPTAMDFHHNNLLLQFTNEVQLLSYTTF